MGELSERDITTVTNKGLKVIFVGNVPGLDVSGIPVLRAGPVLISIAKPEA